MIVFFGAFGYGNLGDDIFLHEIIKRLSSVSGYKNTGRNKNRDKKIMIVGNKKLLRKMLKGRIINNLEVIDKYNLKKILLSVRRSKLVVIGPGGVFGGRLERILSDLYYFMMLLISYLFGKRVVLLSTDIPVRNEKLLDRIYGRILSFLLAVLSYRIYVRFIKNFEELRRIPFFRRKISLGEDLSYRYIKDIKRKISTSVLFSSNKEKDKSCKLYILDDCRDIAKGTSCIEVVRDGWSEDRIEELVIGVKQCDSVISNRLHGVLVALYVGAKKVRAMCYHWKVEYGVLDYIVRGEKLGSWKWEEVVEACIKG